jgi:NAD(P)-dependent dehydrogenase (short-subunit alcohol dehydrogenase family)
LPVFDNLGLLCHNIQNDVPVYGTFEEQGVRIFVTGADRGLGEALVDAWRAQGHQVWAGVLNPSPGGTPLDVADIESVRRAAAAMGPIDLLVNNAGILGDIDTSAWDALDFDEMLRVYNVNVLGTLRVTQAFLPRLMEGEGKLVVNISSEAGSIGQCHRDRWYAYAMAKAALNQQSALIHNLLRPTGGRVLVLHPGHVRTFMRGQEDTTGTLSPAEAAERVLANVDRFGAAAGERPEFRGPDGEALPW